MPESAPGRAFDIPAALRDSLRLFWVDFAPIVGLGFALLTLPGLVTHAAYGPVPDPGDPDYATTGTALEVAIIVLLMVFVAAVSVGGLATLSGRRLEPMVYARTALAAMRPGLMAALVIGAAITAAITLILIAGAVPMGGAVRLLVLAAAVWLLLVWLVAIPAAVAERLTPFAALRRSAELTRGHRWRLLALVAVVLVALMPAAMLVNVVMFGPDATADTAELLLARMGLDHPALWIGALFELLVYGLLACVPPVLYAHLVRRAARA